MTDTIYGLSNEDYHFNDPYREYLSSSALKHYLKSPRFARFAFDNPADRRADKSPTPSDSIAAFLQDAAVLQFD